MTSQRLSKYNETNLQTRFLLSPHVKFFKKNKKRSGTRGSLKSKQKRAGGGGPSMSVRSLFKKKMLRFSK